MAFKRQIHQCDTAGPIEFRAPDFQQSSTGHDISNREYAVF